MDLEFSILFRENETKGPDGKNSASNYGHLYEVQEKRANNFSDTFGDNVLNCTEKEDMKRYVDRK